MAEAVASAPRESLTRRIVHYALVGICLMLAMALGRATSPARVPPDYNYLSEFHQYAITCFARGGALIMFKESGNMYCVTNGPTS